MYKIRQIKYSQGSISVQVYKIEQRKRVVVRHIGTARNDEEREALLSLAKDYIKTASKQLSLFDEDQASRILYLNKTELIGTYYTFLYDLLRKLMLVIGFDKIKSRLLLDLVIIRMIEPAAYFGQTMPFVSVKPCHFRR